MLIKTSYYAYFNAHLIQLDYTVGLFEVTHKLLFKFV